MKINGFSVRYPGGFSLKIEDTEVEKGRIYGLIGANGSGKSTFIKALAGVTGTVDGVHPLQRDVLVSYLPQKPYPFRKSVLDNILLAGGDRGRALELIKALGIESLQNRRAHHLSGGETARMALARALMADCDLLLLDEPTAAMDMEATMLAENAIVNACASIGCTVMLVTHSVAQASRIADETLFFNGGQIIERGETGSLLSSPGKYETKRFLDFSGC